MISNRIGIQVGFLVVALLVFGGGCDSNEPSKASDEQVEAPASEPDETEQPRCRVLLTYRKGAETTRNNRRTPGTHHWIDVRFGAIDHVEQGRGLVARNGDGWRVFAPRSTRQFEDGVAKMASRHWYSFTPEGTSRRLHGRLHETPTLEPRRIAAWLVERNPTRHRPGGYYSGIDSDIASVVGGAVTFDTLTVPEALRYRTLDWNGKPLPVLKHLREAGHAEFDTWLEAQTKEPHWASAAKDNMPMNAVGGPVFTTDGLRFALTFDDKTAYPTTEDGRYDVPGGSVSSSPDEGWWRRPNGCAFSFAESDILVRTEKDATGRAGADWHPDWMLTSVTWLEPDKDVPYDKLEERRAQARNMAAGANADARGLAGKGKLEEAVEALHSGLRHAGDDPGLLNELGFLELQRGQMDAARNALSLAWIHRGEPTASGADGDDLVGRILYNLGRWSEANGDDDSARTFYRRSLERRPNKTVEERLSKIE